MVLKWDYNITILRIHILQSCFILTRDTIFHIKCHQCNSENEHLFLKCGEIFQFILKDVSMQTTNPWIYEFSLP